MLSYFHTRSISGIRLNGSFMDEIKFFYEIMAWQRAMAKDHGAGQYRGIRGTDEEISTRTHTCNLYM